MELETFEGTWDELSQYAKTLAGRRLRLTVLDNESLPTPNQKALKAIRRVAERNKTMPESEGNSVDIIRQGREGELYS